MTVGEASVLEAEEMEHRGVEVAHVDRVLDDVVAEVIPVDDAVIVNVPLDKILKLEKVIIPLVVGPDVVPEKTPELLRVNEIV